jgi:hypothetical protein
MTLLAISLLTAGAMAADPSSRDEKSKSEKSGSSSSETGKPVIGTAPGGHGGSAGATGAPVGSGNTGTDTFHSTGASGTKSAGTDPNAKGVTGGAR